MFRKLYYFEKELLTSLTGKLGSAFLLIFLSISLYAIIYNPVNFGDELWNNPSAWADNPKNSPPVWASMFSNIKPVKHTVLTSFNATQSHDTANGTYNTYELSTEFQYDELPSFTSFSIGNITYHDGSPLIDVSIMRPDGREIYLYKLVVPGPRDSEESPYRRYVNKPFRLQLSGDPYSASQVSKFLKNEFDLQINSSELIGDIEKIIFGQLPYSSDQEIKTLNGKYTIKVYIRFQNSSDSTDTVKFVIGGSSFGIMGTDSLGRDLARGLLYGFPVALTIGVITSVMATIIGTSLGIVSGYLGGKTDIAIQRLSDVLSNIPLLPILLFLAFILGQKLWIVMATLVVFGWPGMTIVIRSMVLQIKSGQLIEASTAIGVSKFRIMFKHIFPQIAPFVLAQMIFFTPAAILAEAGLSFLGLGDPSIPTWGQILDQGFKTGAVYVGYWWWVLPPGILIILTALTFVFIALGMEQIVDPRLRRVNK
jgi:peptide/nickel transport system permease protein